MSDQNLKALQVTIQKLYYDFTEHRKETRENFKRVFEKLTERAEVCALTRGHFDTEIKNLKKNQILGNKAISNEIDKEQAAQRWRVGLIVATLTAAIGWIISLVMMLIR